MCDFDSVVLQAIRIYTAIYLLIDLPPLPLVANWITLRSSVLHIVFVHLPEHLPPPLSMVQGPAALASLGSHLNSQVLLSKTLPF